ncbi:uncharacterized protein LY89DRAFT_676949 [Mollisia scopiformis]|uniref:Ubiquitin-conjugating enzyme E2C-binding protein n=1 Tax=Mollisia scopiformis TaxID=149040 RepID=A0A132B812_MOLSC|nr:uncharacterized protein LY89DRAFT_676949 [Mollisia scopiformis]KUJ08548.1 hypothetical protein LY89DRAFT_676949 [Mollisia scopiformis]
MAQPKILLYAELLPNIRQVSVMAAFDTPSDSTTEAELSADGRQINVIHEGTNHILNLPGQAVASTKLQKPVNSNKELSWRLPVVGLPSNTSVDRGQSSGAPWSAKELGPDSRFSCRGCGAVIVPEGAIESWRDLPSENWAEMMDFWHCHKPDTGADAGNSQAGHDQNAISNANRAYGANTKFIAQSGVGFIDVASFLLDESDCQNLQTSSQEEYPERPQTISCKSCKVSIGDVDIQANGVRLHKWRLSSTSTSISSSLNSPAISVFISAKLVSILQAQCSSKALLIPESPSSTGSLHLWILQQSLFYSSSISGTGSRTFAMKVLWKLITDVESLALIDSGKAEDVKLPADAVAEIETCLRDSARFLPPSARMFQGWNVGLLERYQDEQ